MARPVHIICSASSSTDRITNQISLFQIIDKIQIRKSPEVTEGVKVFVVQEDLQIHATWMAEPEKGDTSEDVFEHELRLIRPDGGISPMLSTTFKFTLADNKRFIRMTVGIPGSLPFDVPGIYSMESRIRKEGHSDWISQSCPLWVEHDDFSTA